MLRKFYTRGFGNDNSEAVFICFNRGIRIVSGTVGTFASDIISFKVKIPFVCESKDGDLAVGGLREKDPEYVRKYIFNAVISNVKRNHESGMMCGVSPVHIDREQSSLLLVTPFVPEDGLIRNTDESYERLETFVKAWMDGYPGVFV